MVDNVTVVIRSSGERTESLCYEIVSKEVPQENIFIIHETPFSQAVRRNFEIGIEKALPWTIGLDADVLLKSEAISHLVKLAEAQVEIVFEIQGRVLDKLFCVPKPGGPHLFRTELITKAVHLIPSEGTTLRPESAVIDGMKDEGYPYVHKDVVLGIHDYEQYFKDIYRKAIVHINKFAKFDAFLETTWNQLLENDPDYQVAIWGLKTGKIFGDDVRIDKSKYPVDISIFLQLKGWHEKSTLQISEQLMSCADKLINEYSATEELKKVEKSINTKKRRLYMRGRLKDEFILLPHKIVWKVGVFYEKIGKMFKKLANSLVIY